jgi:uncharacterized protein (DUF1778 family)
MATTRLEMRIEEDIKAKIEKASALRGETMTSYVVSLMDEDATKVIAQHESITIKDDIFDRFMSACAEARKPNKALTDAATFTKNQGIK